MPIAEYTNDTVPFNAFGISEIDEKPADNTEMRQQGHQKNSERNIGFIELILKSDVFVSLFLMYIAWRKNGTLSFPSAMCRCCFAMWRIYSRSVSVPSRAECE